MTTKLALQAQPSTALEVRRERDDARGVPVCAQMRDVALETFQRECPGPTPVADRRDERVVGTKTRHVPSMGDIKEVRCGAGFKVDARPQGSLRDAATMRTLRRSFERS